MDRSINRRPATQTQRQITTNTTFGKTEQPVPKAMPARTVDGFVTTNNVSPKPAPERPRIDLARNLNPQAPKSRPAEPALSVSDAGKPTLGSIAVAGGQPELYSAVMQARRVPIDMDLPGEDSPWHLSAKIKQRSFRRRATRVAAGGMALVVMFGGVLFSQSYLKLHQVFKGTGTAAALQANVKPELLKGEGRGRINILLLGRGGGTHDAPDLTDTMMIASIDPINHTSTLLSLPRDLWVNVPDNGVMKINAAWESGVYKYLGKMTLNSSDPKAVQAGFKTVDQTVSDVLGLTIDYNVLVDFQAFKQAIDTVGGVSVNVPTDLIDPTMAWENGHNPVLAKAGTQAFDGKHALIYARSRETSSDFARGQRQRALLLALKSKMVTLGTLSNPIKISGLINSFGNNVQTDLSINNASRLYKLTKGIGDNKILSMSLADEGSPLVTTGNISGQSVVLPKAGLFKYDAIQQYVRGQLKDPYIMREHARVTILNGTNVPGLASKKADELKSYGYNVISVGNTPGNGWLQSVLVDLTHKNKYTKHYLEQRLGTTATNQLADTTVPTNGADFVIIIGSNEVNSPVNQAY